jgi:hypothetical protein
VTARLIAGALLALALTTGADAQNFGGAVDMKLDWQAIERGGRPVVTGRLVNRSGYLMYDVRVVVESLDAGGRVIARTMRFVPGMLGPDMYGEFEVGVPAGATHRVTVSYDRIESPSFR